MRPRRETLVHVPAAIAAVGAVLLVFQWAGARPLWLDEEFLAVSLRDRGITDYVKPLWLGQTAPFGWLTLERLTVLAFGTGERALRLIPLLFGIATIATAVWIGRRWMTLAGASTLVLLCAFAQWLTYHVFELKPYSADAFLALLVPAVAVWSVETSRPAMFWIVAAIAQWFGNGALFVTPLCALVLAATLARRDGWRSALRFSICGVVWLGSFALNYVLVLRHASSSAFFYRFWSGAFPPLHSGPIETLRWFGTQLGGFDVKPGSARIAYSLWLTAVGGFIVGAAERRLLAPFFATVPVAAVLLTALRVVPFYERITLWMVPSLYIGVALLADAAWRSLTVGGSKDRPLRLRPHRPLRPHDLPSRDGLDIGARPRVGDEDAGRREFHVRRGRPLGRPAAVVGLVMAVLLCGDIALRGALDGMRRGLSVADSHRLDDRTAVRWLKAQKQTGDVWMTTHYGAPAIWWYAGIADERIIEVGHQPQGPECRDDGLNAAIANAPRVLLYLGFRFDDVPPGFDDLLVRRLSALGSVTAYRPFADAGGALIIDRRVPSAAPTTMSKLDPRTAADQKPIDGCFTVRVAGIPTFVR